MMKSHDVIIKIHSVYHNQYSLFFTDIRKDLTSV